MDEYIEREIALFAITVDGFEHFSGCLSSSEVSLIEMMRDTVSEIPAADVEPVKHGQWEYKGEQKGYFCSNCHSGCLLNMESDWHLSKYCPHCGAKMDLEE